MDYVQQTSDVACIPIMSWGFKRKYDVQITYVVAINQCVW